MGEIQPNPRKQILNDVTLLMAKIPEDDHIIVAIDANEPEKEIILK
jgi:hypothetical protein